MYVNYDLLYFSFRHCLDTFGKEKYEKIKTYCENNEEPEIK